MTIIEQHPVDTLATDELEILAPTTAHDRLAELVHLLSERPLPDAAQAVADSVGRSTDDADPMWIVADALVHLRRQRTSTTSPLAATA